MGLLDLFKSDDNSDQKISVLLNNNSKLLGLHEITFSEFYTGYQRLKSDLKAQNEAYQTLCKEFQQLKKLLIDKGLI